MRVKFTQAILDQTDGTPLAGASVEVLRTGAVINEADTIGDTAGDYTVDVYQPGDLAAGDIVQVLKAAGTLSSTLFTIDSIVANASDFTVTFSSVNGADVTVADGDRLVLQGGVSGHRVTLYSDDTGSGTKTNPVTVPSSGMVEFWVSVLDFDLYITGTGVTTTYYCDLTVGNRVLKNNYAGTTAPDADVDQGDGYGIGSLWIDTTNDEVYMCVDASVAAAVWKQLS